MYDLDYHKPGSLAAAAAMLSEHEDFKVLAGGMSLIPALKMRLARYAGLVDLGALAPLKGIRREGEAVVIGAMTPHAEVAASDEVAGAIPALAALAGGIGDPLVRNRGTLGGSIANADPAADYPAGVLGLGATVVTNRRSIAADDFFVGLFETALEPGEIITEVRFPIPEAAGYCKFRQPASRFALAGVFVARTAKGVRVAVTGAAPSVFRFKQAEAALSKRFDPAALAGIVLGANGLNSDIHASAEYRAHCVMVMTKRAVEECTRSRRVPDVKGQGNHPAAQPAKSARIGEPVRRKEDLRLVTGAGCFSDDVNLAGQAYAVMVRSPHAHARFRVTDTAKARAVPGVIAVLTGRDLLADGMKPIPHRPFSPHPADIPLVNTDGTPMFTAPHFALAIDKVRHVGEALAMVIAETIAAAKDGAELVEIDYELLPAVAHTAAAARPDAPRLFDDARSNVCLDAEAGNREATEAAFKRATHVVRFETWVPRVTGVPMEPRAAVGAYDAASGHYTLHAGTSGAWRTKMDLAIMLGVPEDAVRVITREVGGHFGTRGMLYGEFALVVWAARRVGCPVKWTCERHEAFATDYQGRDLVVEAELALDAQGNFLAMRGANLSNAGGHTTNFSPLRKGVEIMSSIYRVPAAHFRARGVVSNTAPTRPYRSSGRPEVLYVMERLIDLAARECGFDRVALRRRNLVSEAEMPYTNPFGMIYDSGAYHRVMEKALELGDWAGFPARRAEARARGKCRGIGVANYVDTASGVPRERAEMTVHPDGTVDVIIGTVSTGQGHETSFAQLVTDWLGVPFDNVRILTGDTEFVKFGGGTHSGRGLRLASIVIWNAAQTIIEKGKRIAALLLECEPGAVAFREGMFTRPGATRTVSLADVARGARELAELPEDLRGPLAAVSDETVSVAQFPYGCQVAEVEIDPELGTLEIMRYTAVDDVGRAVNPAIIHGQVHGGIAQGVGQALLEHCYYDPATGQLLSGSFMDYAMPRADNFPFFNTEFVEIPSPTHPLGMRPAGEGGTAPALGVMINAIVDALSEFGVRHVEMPATPERIWRAIREVRAASQPRR